MNTIVFIDGEDVVFKQSCTHKERTGDIVVTTYRVIFLPNDNGPPVDGLNWKNVSSVKYSPPDDKKRRAMMLISSTDTEIDEIIYQLVAPTAEEAFEELEKLKTVVKRFVKKKPKTKNVRPAAVQNDGETNIQSAQIIIKGKLNSMLDDVTETGTDGKINISLTVEKKANIFALNPAVRRAFEAEVPCNMSEMDFWHKYFKAEMFNAESREVGADVGAGNRDDLVSRYAEKDDWRLQLSGAAGRNRVLGEVDREVDLTATAGDHELERTRGGDSADQAVGPLFERLANKYNKNGVLVVASQSGSSHKTGKNVGQAHELSELNRPSGETDKFVSLHPHRLCEKDGQRPVDHEEVASSSAFGASSRSRRGAGVASLRPAADLARSMLSFFPSAERAAKVVRAERSHWVPVDATVGIASHSGQALGSLGSHLAGGEGDVCQQGLAGERFEQDMLETFAHTTEALRHFYSILNRTGESAPANGNASAVKAAEIVRQLKAKTSSGLLDKKRKLTEIISAESLGRRTNGCGLSRNEASHKQRCEASIGVISGILGVIQRAASTWETYCGEDGASGSFS